jgi:hypothetical protein
MPVSSRTTSALIIASIGGVLLPAAWYGRPAVEDSGAFALVLFGIPLLCATLALWAERTSATMPAPAVVAVLGLVSLAWAVVTGLGIGLVFLPSAFLLLVAAGASWRHRVDTREHARASRT